MSKYRKVKKTRHFTPNYVDRGQPMVWHPQYEKSRENVIETSSEDEVQYNYSKYPQQYYQNDEYYEDTDDSIQGISDMSLVSMTLPKQVRPFRITKKKTHGKSKPYKKYERDYDSNTDQEYDREYRYNGIMPSEEESSMYEYRRSIKPPKVPKQEAISNISVPILQKTSIEDFEIDIQNVLQHHYHEKDKQSQINLIMRMINKSLLVSINSCLNFNNKELEGGDESNASFNSQLSDQVPHTRIANFDTSDWNIAPPEIEMTINTLVRILNLVKRY